MRFRGNGFTILELLVATTVLAMLSVLLLQIVDHTMRSTGSATRQIEQAVSGRHALDAMEADLQNLVFGGGAALLWKTETPPTMDALAFCVNGRGPSTTAADASPRFLAVSYWCENSGNATTLWRGYSPVPYSATNLPAAAAAAFKSTAYPPTPVASRIVRGLILFEMDDGSLTVSPPADAMAAAGSNFQGATVPGGWSAILPRLPKARAASPRVRALVIVFATLDDGSLAKLDAASLTSIRSVLANPTTQTQMRDVAGYWDQLSRTNPTMPAVASRALRAWQKRIPLP
ncbi:MAG: hypothetical protein Fur0032_23580 [Terrimicrobiaceae bacterium]